MIEKNVKFLSSLFFFECWNIFYFKGKECFKIYMGFICLCIVLFDFLGFVLF